jgi:hypothetical protein
MKACLLQVELEHEKDGRWSAWIEALPGCATWGYSREEALEALKEAAQAYRDSPRQGWVFHELPTRVTPVSARSRRQVTAWAATRQAGSPESALPTA